MIHGLIGFFSVVHAEVESRRSHSLHHGRCNFFYYLDKPCQNILWRFYQIGIMLPRDDERVAEFYGIDVEKRDKFIILVNSLRWSLPFHDLTKDTIHKFPSINFQ